MTHPLVFQIPVCRDETVGGGGGGVGEEKGQEENQNKMPANHQHSNETNQTVMHSNMTCAVISCLLSKNITLTTSLLDACHMIFNRNGIKSYFH